MNKTLKSLFEYGYRSTILFAAIAIFLTYSSAFAGSMDKVASSANEVCPIKVGDKIADFSLIDKDSKKVKLDKVFAKKPTVLIFYRGSWCPYCNVHLGELQTIESKLIDLGYQIVGISPDLPQNLKDSAGKNKLNYQLLSDSDASLTKALGLAYRVDDKTNEMLLSYKIDIENASGEKHRILPVPAALIVDTNSQVKFIFYSPDYKVRVNTEVLLAAAKSEVKK